MRVDADLTGRTQLAPPRGTHRLDRAVRRSPSPAPGRRCDRRASVLMETTATARLSRSLRRSRPSMSTTPRSPRVRIPPHAALADRSLQRAPQVHVIDGEKTRRCSPREDTQQRALQVVIQSAREQHRLERLPHREIFQVTGERSAHVAVGDEAEGRAIHEKQQKFADRPSAATRSARCAADRRDSQTPDDRRARSAAAVRSPDEVGVVARARAPRLTASSPAAGSPDSSGGRTSTVCAHTESAETAIASGSSSDCQDRRTIWEVLIAQELTTKRSQNRAESRVTAQFF